MSIIETVFSWFGYYKKQIIVETEPTDTEYWKEVPEFPKTFVSNLGNIKNVTKLSDGSMRETLRNTQMNYEGDIYVTLQNQSRKTSRMVHTLVAELFLPNPKKYNEVVHKNGNRSDCRVSNLEWKSASERLARTNKKVNLAGQFKIHRVDIKTGEVLSEYDTLKSAVDDLMKQGATGTHAFYTVRQILSDAVNAKRSSVAYGFKWKKYYLNQDNKEL